MSSELGPDLSHERVAGGARFAPPSLRSVRQSLSTRLVLRLSATIAVVIAAFAWLNYRATEAHWNDLTRDNARRTSELVKAATHFGMLSNRKQEVHHTIRKIAREPGVVGVRVYDKQGTIVFSGRPDEEGARVDTGAEACSTCHAGNLPLSEVPHADRIRTVVGPDGGRALGLISPIENEPGCSGASCHPSPRQQTVLGVLDVQVSMAMLQQALASSKRQFLWATIVVILAACGGATLFIVRMVQRPVRDLIEGTARVARGDLDARLEVPMHDELGQLAHAFNHMTDDLKRANDQLTDWSLSLERKVADKTSELERAQRQVLVMEKMASLGKLAATVAHELNNPLAGMLTYAKLVERDLDEVVADDEHRAELVRYLRLIQQESNRCGAVVRNMLLFARDSGAELAPVHLNEVIDRSLMLIRHRAELAGVELQCERLDGDDVIVCDEGQVQQCLLALFVNAVESMSECAAGTLAVRTRRAAEGVVIEVSDTGVGIEAEVAPHLFEPFFSTKESNGVGLGLAVVYGIVRRHGGAIDVTSVPGHGARFIVSLPWRPTEDGAIRIVSQEYSHDTSRRVDSHRR